jgi:hypothetical protein
MADSSKHKYLPNLLLPVPNNDVQPRPSMSSPLSSVGPTSPKNEGVEMNEFALIVRPVEWPTWIKNIVLFQVVSHAGLASWCSSAFVRVFLLFEYSV